MQCATVERDSIIGGDFAVRRTFSTISTQLRRSKTGLMGAELNGVVPALGVRSEMTRTSVVQSDWVLDLGSTEKKGGTG